MFVDKFNDFLILVLGLIVEAFPFIIVGTLISLFLDVFIKKDIFYKILPKNKILSHFFISLFGIFLPVCECGNVPVVRKFLLKDLKLSHALSFLFAAPIINPITIWTTYTAFNFDTSFVFLRILGALLISTCIGYIFSFTKDDKKYLSDEFYKDVCTHDHSKGHSHSHDHSHNHDHSHPEDNNIRVYIDLFIKEFVIVMHAMVIGSIIAGIFQTFVPRSFLLYFGEHPILSVLMMILLSFVISICATVDAFFALSFVSSFTKGSLLSFLVFGPMIDIKLLSMLKSTFTTRLLVMLTTLIFLLSFSFGLIINLIY